MDNFKIIYRILRHLERSLDCEYVDNAPISHNALGISRERWEQLLAMLESEGYINGIVYAHDDIYAAHLRITLRGLEYLAENSLMARAKSLIQAETVSAK